MTLLSSEQWAQMQAQTEARVRQHYAETARQRAEDLASWQAAADAQHAKQWNYAPQPTQAQAQGQERFSIGDFQGAYYKRFGRWPTLPEQQAAREAWERGER